MIIMEKDRKPAIRFKGFTDAWEQRKLGDVVNVYDGVHKTPDYTDGGIMFLSVENISTLKSEKYISEEAFNRDFKVYPEKGDVLMTRIGDVGTPNVVETTEKVAFYVSLALLKPTDIDSYFLRNSILSAFFQNGLKERTLVTAIPQKINKDEIGKVSLFVSTSIDEQREIGTFFRNLDNLITLHQRKCEKFKNIKKSMLEKLFPQNGETVPEIRFKGFTDAWEQRKLGDCFTERVESMLDGELISVTINNGIKKFSELGRHDNSNDDKSKYKKVCVGDIAYNSMRMWQGASGYSSYEGIVSPAYTVLSPNSGINSKCLAYQFKLPEMIHTFQVNSQGITSDNWNLKYPVLSKIEIFVSKDEQEQAKIAEYFENLDNLITLHQRKVEKLQNIKKSCLEKMFVS